MSTSSLLDDVDAHEGAADLVGDAGAVRLVEVADDDLGALLGEPPHGRETDARAPAGDDRDLAVEPACHVDPFQPSDCVRSCRQSVEMKTFLTSVNASSASGPELAPDAALLEAAERASSSGRCCAS